MKKIFKTTTISVALAFAVTTAIAREYGNEFATLDGCLAVLGDLGAQKQMFEGQFRHYKDQTDLLPSAAREHYETFLIELQMRTAIAIKLQKRLVKICSEYE